MSWGSLNNQKHREVNLLQSRSTFRIKATSVRISDIFSGIFIYHLVQVNCTNGKIWWTILLYRSGGVRIVFMITQTGSELVSKQSNLHFSYNQHLPYYFIKLPLPPLSWGIKRLIQSTTKVLFRILKEGGYKIRKEERTLKENKTEKLNAWKQSFDLHFRILLWWILF